MRIKNNLFLGILIVSLVFFAYLAIAAHVITPTSINVLEDASRIYNITVNNSDTTLTANITQINITLPSSFTFTGATNATDAGAHEFTNTSTVLSWTNASGLVMNLTLKRFWFNATASTPGTYNISVLTLNATGAFRSNVSVTVNDTSAPVISLISPDDATSSTTSEYNFTFNVTDEGTISSCSLIVDNSAINSLSTVNTTGGTNGMYNSSFAEGSHTWSINCTDGGANTQNSSSRTFTVTVEETVTETNTVSSGNKYGPTYQPTQEDMKNGYELKRISKNAKVSFKIRDGTEHNFKLDSVTTKATFTISSDPVTDSLEAGQTKDYDIDRDGVYDLRIFLKEIISSKATFVFTIIDKAAPAVAEAETAKAIADQAPEGLRNSPEADVTKTSSAGWIIGVILAVIVVAVVVIISMKKGRKTPRYRK